MKRAELKILKEKVTPILGKGIYQGRIDKIGSVKAKII